MKNKNKNNNIYLIGPMGAGKSTTGKKLAGLIGNKFYDLDQEIINRNGVEISWIFEFEGEAGFRQREHDLIKELSQKNDIVCATGGGCVTTPANCEILMNSGIVIYLSVSIDTQLQRIATKKSHRPIFNANNSKEKLQLINQAREHIYKKLADLTYSSDNQSSESLAEQIFSDYKNLKLLG